MVCLSEWYSTLGEYSFPTVFLHLAPAEIRALVAAEIDGACVRGLIQRLQTAIRSLPGSAFVGADCCAPTDSPLYRHGRGVAFARRAWRLLTSSDKVRQAFETGATEKLTVRPVRRMERAREFRMFFRNRQLVGMSQYCLVRHFARLAKREQFIWRRGQQLAARLAERLPSPDQVVDVYLCSDERLLLIDINPWGDGTDPKLFRTWDRAWDEQPGLRLMPRPIDMKGDISISF